MSRYPDFYSLNISNSQKKLTPDPTFPIMQIKCVFHYTLNAQCGQRGQSPNLLFVTQASY